MDRAEVPLAPLVEWLLSQWDPLLHEGRLPSSLRTTSAAAWRVDVLSALPDDDDALDNLLDRREAWWQRHGCGAALPEYRVPDLHLRRVDDRVELSWDDREWRSVSRGVRLNEAPGAVLLPADEVATVLHGWASAVLDALRDTPGIEDFLARMDTLLSDCAHPTSVLSRLQWAAGQQLEQAAARLRSLAGLSSGSVDETVRALLDVEASGQNGLVTPLTVPAMLFRSAAPALSDSDLVALLHLGRDLPKDRGELVRYQVRAPAPQQPTASTQDGYARATELRQALGVPADNALTDTWDLETVLLPRLGVRVEDLRLDDTHVDGVALRFPERQAVVAVNRSGRFSATPWGRRMTLGHELCHLLHDADGSGQVGLVSNPWAPYLTERRANAFAAMLLLPPSALGALLPDDSGLWTPAILHEAMRLLQVGRSTLTWHLYNLGWITASERQAWVDLL